MPRELDQDQISRFLRQASGRMTLDWRHGETSWRLTVAHTHGDVVALAVWCDDQGYVAYREEVSADFLRELHITPPAPLLYRLRRAWEQVLYRFRR